MAAKIWQNTLCCLKFGFARELNLAPISGYFEPKFTCFAKSSNRKFRWTYNWFLFFWSLNLVGKFYYFS
ncbi:hypothetical protein H740_10342 [Campylobacter showae CC57C]|uniref:Uncharacterized protein n=1 Tax=Campylobacter showae CC57C TaxID=1073353 RepID=M3JAG3_9BACT|nr:hypothetical protein H740_10342 [Campylobacter showae CC57C]